ncbi:hypothetical protein EDM68_00080 [Candidatus Uhrbacteria bacterium]|nr:MAG: hypothetical protein EDM68_00080 [Candidatus Uhrbacteria bacterium]
MKTHVFIVCGYGVPKDIEKDFNYQLYLRTAFNQIFDVMIRHPKDRGLIVASGGPTDMRRPYKRTEAHEMAKVIKRLLARPALKGLGKRVRIVEEGKSLSSMENILFSKRKLSGPAASVTIFCEWTRRKKQARFGREIFKQRVTVSGIDFDQSANRYQDPEFIAKKEALDMKLSMRALKNPEDFRKLHDMLEEKFATLRAAGAENHVKAVKEHWEKVIEEFDEA